MNVVSSTDSKDAIAKAVATLDPNLQYVDGPTLLKILFPEECRPTLRWLRDQQKARRVPFVRIGRLIFFCPAHVRSALERKQYV